MNERQIQEKLMELSFTLESFLEDPEGLELCGCGVDNGKCPATRAREEWTTVDELREEIAKVRIQLIDYRQKLAILKVIEQLYPNFKETHGTCCMIEEWVESEVEAAELYDSLKSAIDEPYFEGAAYVDRYRAGEAAELLYEELYP